MQTQNVRPTGEKIFEKKKTKNFLYRQVAPKKVVKKMKNFKKKRHLVKK